MKYVSSLIILFFMTTHVYAGSTYNPSSGTGTGSGGGPQIYLGTTLTTTNPSINTDLSSGLYTPLGSTVAIATGGVEAMQWNPIASAVNYISVTPGITGTSAIVSSAGTDTNVILSLRSKGTSPVNLSPNAVKQVETDYTASAVNYLTFTGATTGNNPNIAVAGTDTNIGLNISSQAAAQINFKTNGGTQLQIGAASLNPVNFVNIVGQVSGSAPGISAQGADTNISLSVTSKGTGK